ncbi:hypothetical protein BJ508DRAFT_333610 [Ascobolus immersus RN42]|uniref:C2H2-type domain-containing protein n=1 Tax=Ascobolus immersus RN42 TaxID=1160509 RepID=A0A3N4HW73_ASCIM|nr:hypothetical protein BJ508DRAFT_333610 [Ascobolus immersus RN42]
MYNCEACWAEFPTRDEMEHHTSTSLHDEYAIVNFTPDSPPIVLFKDKDNFFRCPVRNCSYNTRCMNEAQMHCNGEVHEGKVKGLRDLRKLRKSILGWDYVPDSKAITDASDKLSHILSNPSFQSPSRSDKVTKAASTKPQSKPTLPHDNPEDTAELRRLKSVVKDAIMEVAMQAIDPSSKSTGRDAAARFEDIINVYKLAARKIRWVETDNGMDHKEHPPEEKAAPGEVRSKDSDRERRPEVQIPVRDSNPDVPLSQEVKKEDEGPIQWGL